MTKREKYWMRRMGECSEQPLRKLTMCVTLKANVPIFERVGLRYSTLLRRHPDWTLVWIDANSVVDMQEDGFRWTRFPIRDGRDLSYRILVLLGVEDKVHVQPVYDTPGTLASSCFGISIEQVNKTHAWRTERIDVLEIEAYGAFDRVVMNGQPA